MIHLESGKIEGIITISKGKSSEDMKVVRVLKNLVVNDGFANMFGYNNYLDIVNIGTGTTPPTVNDTSLESFLYSSASNAFSRIDGDKTGVPDPYIYVIVGKTIPAKLSSYSFTEVSFSRSINNNIFNRVLTTNHLGAVEAIEVEEGESVTVSIEVRMYVPPSIQSGTVTVLGSGGGQTINWQATPATYQGSPGNKSLYSHYGWTLSNISSYNTSAKVGTVSLLNYMDPYNNSVNSPTSFNCSKSYNDNTKMITAICNIRTGAHRPESISGMSIESMLGQAWLLKFTPPIQTTISQNLTIKISSSIGRK